MAAGMTYSHMVVVLEEEGELPGWLAMSRLVFPAW